MTKNYILTLDNDFSQMNAGHIYLNKGKIKSFYEKHEGLIRIFKREANDIQNDYFVIENGVIKTEGEGSERKFVLKEGKTLDQYKEAYTKKHIQRSIYKVGEQRNLTMKISDSINDINVESLIGIGIKNAKKDIDLFVGRIKSDNVHDWWFTYSITTKNFILRKYVKMAFPITNGSETIFKDEPAECIDDIKTKLLPYLDLPYSL